MKELVVKTGGKHSKATDILEAQTETLEPLQAFFGNFGSCVISGLDISANGGNWDIAEGIVSIEHADGHKLARFAGATNVALPGYLSITKSTQQGDYGEIGFEVAKDISDTYTATFTAGAPGVTDATVLVIPAPTSGSINTFFDKIGTAANTTPITKNLSVFNTGTSLKFWVNKLSRSLHIQGTITIDSFNGVVTVPEGEYVLFSGGGAELPTYMRPAVKQEFYASVVSTSPYPFKGSNQSDYITVLTGNVDTNGLVYLRWVRPAGTLSTYQVRINAILQLD